jgi:hypothetical protein
MCPAQSGAGCDAILLAASALMTPLHSQRRHTGAELFSPNMSAAQPMHAQWHI